MTSRFEWLLAVPWRLPALVALFIALPVIVQGELAAADARTRAHDEQLAAVTRVAQLAATGLNNSIARVRAQVAAVTTPVVLAVPGVQRFPLIDALRSGDGAGVDAQLSVVQTLVQSGPPSAGVDALGRQPVQVVAIVDANGAVIYDNGSGSVGTSLAEQVTVGGSAAHPELARPLWQDLTGATRSAPTSVSQPLFRSGPRSPLSKFAPNSTQVGLFVAGYIDRARGDAPAYLVIFLDIRPIADQALQPLLLSADELVLVDASGLMLVRCTPTDLCGAVPLAQDVSTDPVVARSLSSVRTSQQDVDPLFLGPTFIASASMPDVGWRVIAARGTGTIDAALDADLQPQRTTRGLLVLLLLGATYLLARSASQVVRQQHALATALAQQTATADVLKVISRSAFDPQPAFESIVQSAVRLSSVDNASLFRGDGEVYRHVATAGTTSDETRAYMADRPVAPGRDSLTGRVALERMSVQIPDIRLDPEYTAHLPGARVRAALGVPIMRGEELLGVLIARRFAPGAFSAEHVTLLETFADQAAIAIENARLIAEIQEKGHELEVASKHKSQFLANMSHELRTPLNAIIGFADVLGQKMFGELNDKQADYLADIGTSGRHLLDLVNQILDLSKVEAGRMELEPSDFSPGETIRGTLAFIRERAAAHRIELAADIPSDLPIICADERKIRQVVLNLLSNAVKFTPDGGRIGVTVRAAEGELRISVQDTGVGIPADEQAAVFEEFHQVGRTSDSSREGTGLGLTLAKQFIELHGGRIWVESAPGSGSTFSVAIPVARPAPAAVA